MRVVILRPFYLEVQFIITENGNEMEGNERVFKKSDLEKHFLTANNVMLDYLEPQLKERLAEAMTSESFTGIV